MSVTPTCIKLAVFERGVHGLNPVPLVKWNIFVIVISVNVIYCIFVQNLKLRKQHCKKLLDFCNGYLIVTYTTSQVYEIRGALKITVFWDGTLCMDVSEGHTCH